MNAFARNGRGREKESGQRKTVKQIYPRRSGGSKWQMTLEIVWQKTFYREKVANDTTETVAIDTKCKWQMTPQNE